MAFLLDRFDIIKQYQDGTGLYMYRDTVGGATDPTTKVKGDLLTAIVGANFFNPVADSLKVPGAIIIISATDGAKVVRVNQVYSNGKPQVTVTSITTA